MTAQRGTLRVILKQMPTGQQQPTPGRSWSPQSPTPCALPDPSLASLPQGAFLCPFHYCLLCSLTAQTHLSREPFIFMLFLFLSCEECGWNIDDVSVCFFFLLDFFIPLRKTSLIQYILASATFLHYFSTLSPNSPSSWIHSSCFSSE